MRIFISIYKKILSQSYYLFSRKYSLLSHHTRHSFSFDYQRRKNVPHDLIIK